MAKKSGKKSGLACFHTCVITSQFQGLQEISPGLGLAAINHPPPWLGPVCWVQKRGVQWKTNVDELLVDVKLLSDLDGTVKIDIYWYDGPQDGGEPHDDSWQDITWYCHHAGCGLQQWTVWPIIVWPFLLFWARWNPDSSVKIYSRRLSRVSSWNTLCMKKYSLLSDAERSTGAVE